MPLAKYQFVITSSGPKILPVQVSSSKDEESPAEYNSGGYLPVNVNDSFKNGRYLVVRKLGWGHFSTVWLVKDTQENRHSALKVVKSAGRYAETARDEIKLLSRVSSFSPDHPGRAHVVSFLDSFFYQAPQASHVCIVFEPLGENLLALIERNKKKGIPRALVRTIAKQILLGLQYLHDECDLVHTDIKPENILISIPDIEAHIQNELSQSPLPTSRRVGIPLPTKSRAGVTIPQSQHRARRQVQIFESQPLSSPGRSVDATRNGHNSVSINARRGGGSGSNSLTSSLVAQMRISKLTGPSAMSASGTVKTLSSGTVKFPSGLSSSVPLRDQVPTCNSDSREQLAKNFTAHNPMSPSTSSSSLASTAESTQAGSSSIISTPPTSLSHSLGNLTNGFLGWSRGEDLCLQTNASSTFDDIKDCPRTGFEVKGRKGKEKLTIEDELKDAFSTSCNNCAISTSRTSRFSGSPSSHKSWISSKVKSKSSQVQILGHRQSHSHTGLPAQSFWKDPGTAAPAPALVVSAVVGADGEENSGNYFDLANANVSASSMLSESSSATATIARPSRTVTPIETSPSSKPTSGAAPLINGAKKVVADLTNTPPDVAADAEIGPSPPAALSSNPNPSLLTQTAPSRQAPTLRRYPIKTHPSPPPHQLSQLSVHMLHDPTSLRMTNSDVPPINPFSKPSALSIPVAAPPPASSPPAPPSTPIDSPPSSTSIPVSQHKSRQEPSMPRLHLVPEELPVAHPPSISIKIADLGNATPSTKHFTEDIQTRQYRAPEAILGRRDWDARADIWSVACVVFELLTADFLFDPHGQGELFTKDDDHMAQVIELLGDFPLEVKMGGKYSRELFDHAGALRYIRTLKPWPLKRVMTEKYLLTEEHSDTLCDFLLPMLAIDMRQRPHARVMLNHSWLSPAPDDEVFDEW